MADMLARGDTRAALSGLTRKQAARFFPKGNLTQTAKTRAVAASLLSLVLAATLLPVMPGSASEAEAVEMGNASGLVAAPNLEGSRVYLGKNGSRPLLWNVVKTDASGVTLWVNESITSRQYDGTAHRNWTESGIKKYLNAVAPETATGFLATAFGEVERGSLLPYSNTPEQGKSGNQFTPSEKVVLPSLAEIGEGAATGTWGIDQAKRALRYAWWLRTPGDTANQVGAVQADGTTVSNMPSADTATTRPAVRVDLGNIVLTSTTGAGGKESVSMGAGFDQITDPGKKPVKLTLIEPDTTNLSLGSATLDKTTAAGGDTLNLTFAGAKTGTRKFVSVLLVNQSGFGTHYAKISNMANGTATLQLPSSAALPGGQYTLQVFNEQVVAGVSTDFASDPIEIPLTITSTGLSREGTSNVSYDTSTIIPGTANWGVQIPQAITFSDKMNESVSADVLLINMDGGALDEIQQLPANGVSVSVGSAKGMIMDIDANPAGQKDPIEYEITYTGAAVPTGPLTLNGTNLGVGDSVVMAHLTIVNHAAMGQAKRKEIAGSNGSHTDVLTFTFDNGQPL